MTLISDICELKRKNSISDSVMSDLSIFASMRKLSSKLTFTHGSAVLLKLVTVTPFLSIAYSYCWKVFELSRFPDCVVNLLSAESQLNSQLTYFFLRS